MNNQEVLHRQLLSLLEGTWTGEGRGKYPTVQSFDYRETLTFTRQTEKSLSYEQRTQKRHAGQTAYLPSHGEHGFIQILETGEVELTNTQAGGRSEVLVGTVEIFSNLMRVHFSSKILTNDPRMIASARTFELEDDTLRYEMSMHTTKVDHLTPHLKITLQRVS